MSGHHQNLRHLPRPRHRRRRPRCRPRCSAVRNAPPSASCVPTLRCVCSTDGFRWLGPLRCSADTRKVCSKCTGTNLGLACPHVVKPCLTHRRRRPDAVKIRLRSRKPSGLHGARSRGRREGSYLLAAQMLKMSGHIGCCHAETTQWWVRCQRACGRRSWQAGSAPGKGPPGCVRWAQPGCQRPPMPPSRAGFAASSALTPPGWPALGPPASSQVQGSSVSISPFIARKCSSKQN